MENYYHYYVVKLQDDCTDVLGEFYVSYMELRLEMLAERMKGAGVSIVPNSKYRISVYKNDNMDFSYCDVCFYSDEKGDVHYGSRRVDSYHY